MLKFITIHLTEPICQCENQNLGWQIYFYENNTKDGLIIFCKSCDVALQIPHEKFRANFKLEKAYPGGLIQKNNVADEEYDRKFLKDLGIVPNLKADS